MNSYRRQLRAGQFHLVLFRKILRQETNRLGREVPEFDRGLHWRVELFDALQFGFIVAYEVVAAALEDNHGSGRRLLQVSDEFAALGWTGVFPIFSGSEASR